jgi:hypothetical protein
MPIDCEHDVSSRPRFCWQHPSIGPAKAASQRMIA